MPAMLLAEYQALVTSIAEHGLRDPIVLLGGRILDGRHRYSACCELSREPVTVTVDMTDVEALAYVIDKNLARRHLNESQRSMIAAKVATLQKGQRKSDSLIELSQTEAADALNVSPASLKRAKTVQEKGVPDLGAAVAAGTVPVSVAAQVAQMPTADQEHFVAEVTSETNTKPAHQVVAAMKRDSKREAIVEQAQVTELHPTDTLRTTIEDLKVEFGVQKTRRQRFPFHSRTHRRSWRTGF